MDVAGTQVPEGRAYSGQVERTTEKAPYIPWVFTTDLHPPKQRPLLGDAWVGGMVELSQAHAAHSESFLPRFSAAH